MNDIKKELSENDLTIIKGIFQNPSRAIREEFLNSQFLKDMWPFFLNHLTQEHCFKMMGNAKHLGDTLRVITWELDERDLRPP